MPRRIVYVQHAVDFGGSCMSLLHTVQGLDRQRYTPVVALTHPAPEVVQLYANAGIEVVQAPGIAHFAHSQGHHVRWRSPTTWGPLLALPAWQRTGHAVEALVQRTAADGVHLNSIVMAPAAHALHRLHVPFVWHVREPPWQGVWGVRHGLLRMALLNWPDAVIFLSARERHAWVGDQRGHVVHNFVDLGAYAAAPTRAAARQTLGIAHDAAVVLYLGGLAPMKGIDALLSALPHVRQQVPQLVCMMPGSVYPAQPSWPVRVAREVLPYVGRGTTVQRLEARMAQPWLAPLLRREPAVRDLRTHLAACNILVFPATREHFARPVVEAAGMGRAVVASDFPILRELVQHDGTGWLVRPGDISALTAAMARALQDVSATDAMGNTAQQRARRLFDQRQQVDAIMAIYDQILGAPPARRQAVSL